MAKKKKISQGWAKAMVIELHEIAIQDKESLTNCCLFGGFQF